MPTISQKLGFDASSAVKNLGSLKNKLAETTQELKNFQAQAGKGVGKLGDNLKKGKKDADGFLVTWKTLARIIGTQFVVRGLASFLGLIKKGIADAHALGLAIEEVQTIAGRETGSAQLTQDILALSDVIGKSSQDLAEAFYQTLSNQVVETGEALEFTAQAAKLATITVSETKDAVNALSSVMNSYGFEAARAEHVANTLFKTVELGRLRLSEIANVIGRVTPLTAAMGVSWEETAASLAVMTRQGVKADTAITQLRAVMTKIIRPTEDMRDIFHAWGVRDGKEAVQTFGGLNGVLKKLAEETGHSSEAMADLLRRVRTIVGQLSLMGDGGEALAETLLKIQESSGELNEQWDKFTQSDAHRLTVEMNEFNNTLTRIGLDAIPDIVRGLTWMNDRVKILALGVRSIAGEFDGAGIHAEIMRRQAIKAGDELRDRAKRFDEEQRQRYDGLVESAGKYYVSVQQAENRLSETRDAAISAATSSVKKQGVAVANFYKDAAKSLSSFVDGINGKIKSNADEIASIEQEITDRKLQAELGKYDSVYQKIKVLEDALSKQRLKARDAFGAIGLDKESRDRALTENQIAIDLAKQQLSLAKSGGHLTTILKAEGSLQGLLTNRKGVYEEQNRRLAEAQPKLKEINDEVQKGEKDLQSLVAERNKLYESGALDAPNAERRKKALETLEALNKKIDEVAAGAGRHDAFLQSLGLDTGLGEVTDALTKSLNDAHKDWVAEVQLWKAAFESETFHLRVVIDTDGVISEAAKQLGLERIPGEGEAGFGRRVGEASVAALKEYGTLQENVENRQVTINSQLASMEVELGHANEATLQYLKGLASTHDILANNQTILSKMTFGIVEAGDAQKSFTDAMRSQRGLALDLVNGLQKANITLQAGRAITDQEISALEEKLNLAHFNEQITEEQTETLRALLGTIKGANVAAKEMNAIQEDLPEQAKLEALLAVEESLKAGRDAQLSHTQAAAQTEERIRAAKIATDNHRQSILGGTESQKQQTVAAEATVQATEDIGTTANNNIMIINGVATAFSNVATEARKAAAAAASVGGPAAQFHGGQMARFFADGGQVGRGQDKILTALSRGETVVNSRNSSRFASELNAMNQGSKPVFREQGGPVTNVGDVNVTVNGGDTAQRTVRAIAHGIRRDFQRGNIKLR